MKAVITGISGQDGAWLAKELIDDGVEVHGFVRRGSLPKTPRTDYLNISDNIIFHVFPLSCHNNPFTFSNIKNFGCFFSITSKQLKNTFPLLSSNPLLFPAVENG